MNTVTQTAFTSRTTLGWPGWLPLVAMPITTILFRNHLSAWLFMWALSFAIFAGLKWMTWWKGRSSVAHTPARSVAYLLAWPGMDAEAFLDASGRAERPQIQEWLWASSKTALGVLLLWAIARRVPAEQFLVQGWIGMFGLIFLLHFGTFHLISLLWRTVGIDAEPIMSKPMLSRSLSEFWGKRWNLGFRQLAHQFIFRPVQGRTGVAAAGFLVFIVSGLIHDLVISVPARGGYGLPTVYFAVQGLGVLVERSEVGRRLGIQKRGWRARVFAIVVTAAPAFWLFHPPFVRAVMLPFMHAIRAL